VSESGSPFDHSISQRFLGLYHHGSPLPWSRLLHSFAVLSLSTSRCDFHLASSPVCLFSRPLSQYLRSHPFSPCSHFSTALTSVQRETGPQDQGRATAERRPREFRKSTRMETERFVHAQERVCRQARVFKPEVRGFIFSVFSSSSLLHLSPPLCVLGPSARCRRILSFSTIGDRCCFAPELAKAHRPSSDSLSTCARSLTDNSGRFSLFRLRRPTQKLQCAAQVDPPPKLSYRAKRHCNAFAFETVSHVSRPFHLSF